VTDIARRSITVVSAGLGDPSATRLLADRLAAATEATLRADGIDARVTTLELRDYAQDLVNHLLTGFPGPRLKAAIDDVLAADGLIAVTPIFSASFSGLFKLFFDVLEMGSLGGHPVLVGATGGTIRHSLALDHAVRPLFAYLGAAIVPTAVFAGAEDWGGGGTGDTYDGALAGRINRAGGELARAVAARAPVGTAADPFDALVPFEELLRRS
jgi:FMN reductase